MRRHRRRHHRRRRNPSNEDMLTLGLGVLGGGLAMYLYMKSIQQAAASGQNSLVVTTPSQQTG